MIISAACICPIAAEAESVKEFSFSIAKSIEQIEEYTWNRFIPARNILMLYEQLRMIELVHGRNMEFRYVLVKNAGVVTGVLYFQVVPFIGAQLLNYFPENKFQWLKGISEKILNRMNVPLLVSGNIFMTGENGFYFQQEVDQKTKGAVLRKAICEILREAPHIKATLVSDLYEPKTAFDDGFAQARFHEITVESDMSLALLPDWKSFDEYLHALSSKYRVRTRKVLALCAENDVMCKDLGADEVEKEQGVIYDLYMRVMKKAEFRLGELQPSFFAEQKRLLPNNYKLFAYYHQGQMIGFISAYIMGKKMEVHYTGMNHEVCRPIHLYQHMMYDMVKLGIEHKVERLHFGRTAPEIKSTVGAVASPMYGYLKHRNPIVNFLLVKPYTANLKPKQYTLRNPFK